MCYNIGGFDLNYSVISTTGITSPKSHTILRLFDVESMEPAFIVPFAFVVTLDLLAFPELNSVSDSESQFVLAFRCFLSVPFAMCFASNFFFDDP